MTTIIPVVLFAYSRPDHLKRTLRCLRKNNVPLIYAFSDGPKTPSVEQSVREVRKILLQVDWCEIYVVEREKNLGLGESILTGVSQVFARHDTLIVFEDDLVFVPGTYQYLCAALEHYKDDLRVMSVTGWTHPLIKPSNVSDLPYFDGRTESWSWGTWKRVWEGMDQDAMTLVQACVKKKIDIYHCGADLLRMAKSEKKKNIWAVRFAYLHILHGGLCLRPPYSLVDHAGFDEYGTNAKRPSDLSVTLQKAAPPIPDRWPEPLENPECSILSQKVFGKRPPNIAKRVLSKLKRWFIDAVNKVMQQEYNGNI
jgi:hypothetical protein